MTISLLTLSHPIMSHSPGSNWRPARYECAALPTELKWLYWTAKIVKKIAPANSGRNFLLLDVPFAGCVGYVHHYASEYPGAD